MHAVSDLGTYEEIADRALIAGNDIILFCSYIERIPELQRHLAERAKNDAAFGARFAEACKRGEGYREHVARLRKTAPPPVATFDDVIDEAIRFVTKLEETRPHREVFVPDSERRKQGRMPVKGRTGREEWT
jgi:beta-glucosidase-like glycosyl hydrolase